MHARSSSFLLLNMFQELAELHGIGMPGEEDDASGSETAGPISSAAATAAPDCEQASVRLLTEGNAHVHPDPAAAPRLTHTDDQGRAAMVDVSKASLN